MPAVATPVATLIPPHSRDAESPFEFPDTDLILRSNDGVDFHVYKNILTLASEVFAGMVSLPQAAPTITPPVVPLTENEETLDMFLRLIYPIENPEFPCVTDLHAILEALRKYGVDGQEAIMDRALRDLIEEQPEAVFALADRYEYKYVARDAAELTLGRNEIPGPLALNEEELDLISTKEYHRLLNYQKECKRRALAISQNLYWCSPREVPCSSAQYDDEPEENLFIGPLAERCMCPLFTATRSASGLGEYTAPTWLEDYMHRCEDALEEKPTATTVLDWELVESSWGLATQCPMCSERAGKKMKWFMQLFAHQIKAQIATVKI